MEGEATAVETGEAKVQAWVKELDEARKREKKFRKDAVDVVKLFEAEKRQANQYNILYSNTETLAPSLYNATPRPVVQRRFKDEDPIGKLCAEVVQRSLEFLIDPGVQDYSAFDDLMKAATLEALVPGRGVTRFKYEAEFEKVPGIPDPLTGVAGPDTERVKYETVCGEEVPWNRFLHGYGKKWKDVTWIAFEHFMSKQEVKDNFPDVREDDITWSDPTTEGDEGEKDNRQEMGDVKLAQVYEIWDRTTKKVLFLSQGHPKGFLKQVDDPLGLNAFFPCSKPLAFQQKISTLVPIPPYLMYEEQAKELNTVTLRINKLLHMCRVRGVYDSTLEATAQILNAEDGHMVPLQNVAGLLSQGMTLDKSFWIVPFDAVIAALQQLYLAREQIKKVIYEITGIADIMRGSSAASETLGAQEIKQQWGTMRLKRMQKEVIRYTRDSLRIMAEIAVNKLSDKTFSAMTGLPYPTGSQKAAAAMQTQALQAQGQPVPPETTVFTVAPGWPEILSSLKDSVTRNYRIDIETNSTVDAEATEDKQNIAELLNAMAQFLNGVTPLVEQGSMPFETAKQMLLAIIRRFRFGPDLEDSLKTMTQPKPPADPNAGKMQLEQQKGQIEMAKAQKDNENAQVMAQIAIQKAQMDSGIAQQKAELEKEKLALEKETMILEHQIAVADAQMRLQENNQKAALARETHNMKVTQMREQARLAKQQPSKQS